MRSCFISLILAAALFCAAPAFALLSKGQAAPPLKVTTTSGQQVTLANYRGRVLVIDFFATWCPPCRESIPHLVALNSKYGRLGLQVLGLSLDEGGERELKAFVADKRLNYPVAIAGDDLATEYGVRSIPTMYIINKKGMVVERYMGYSDDMAAEMEGVIKRLLAE